MRAATAPNGDPRNTALYEAILRLDNLEDCIRFFDDLCAVTELRTLRLRNHIMAVTAIAPQNAATTDDRKPTMPERASPGASVSKATASEAPQVTPKMSAAANGLRKAV